MLFLLAAAWGGTFPAMKLALSELEVFYFLSLRFGIALLSFIPLLLLTERKLIPDLDGLSIGLMVFSGFMFQVLGLKYTTAINSAFITSLNAPLVPIIGFLLFRRKAKRREILGIILGMFGLALLTGVYKGAKPSIGDLLTLICAVSWAMQILLVDRVTKMLDALELAYSESFSTFLLSTALSFLLRENWTFPDLKGAIAIFYTRIIATTFAFFTQAWAQKRESPEFTGLMLLLELVFASLLASLILKESLGFVRFSGPY